MDTSIQRTERSLPTLITATHGTVPDYAADTWQQHLYRSRVTQHRARQLLTPFDSTKLAWYSLSPRDSAVLIFDGPSTAFLFFSKSKSSRAVTDEASSTAVSSAVAAAAAAATAEAAVAATSACDFLWVRLNSLRVAAPRPYMNSKSVTRGKISGTRRCLRDS